MRNPPRRPPPVLFQIVGVAAFLFILTVLIMVAALFSDPDSPLNEWFNQYGVWLLLGEVAVMFVLGIVGMFRDQGKNDQAP